MPERKPAEPAAATAATIEAPAAPRPEVDAAVAAVLEAVYPVSVSLAALDAALQDDRLNADNRSELRLMARRGDVRVYDR